MRKGRATINNKTEKERIIINRDNQRNGCGPRGKKQAEEDEEERKYTRMSCTSKYLRERAFGR